MDEKFCPEGFSLETAQCGQLCRQWEGLKLCKNLQKKEKDTASVLVAKSHSYHSRNSCSASRKLGNKAVIKPIVSVLLCFLTIIFFLISRCLASWSDSAWPGFYVCMSMCMQISVFFFQLHSTSEIKDKHNTSVSCIARLLPPIYHLQVHSKYQPFHTHICKHRNAQSARTPLLMQTYICAYKS